MRKIKEFQSISKVEGRPTRFDKKQEKVKGLEYALRLKWDYRGLYCAIGRINIAKLLPRDVKQLILLNQSIC